MKLVFNAGLSTQNPTKLAAYLQTFPQENDDVRCGNYALSIWDWLDDMLVKNHMKDSGIKTEFEIVMEFSRVHKRGMQFRMDYQRHPTCPQFVVDGAMPIYTALKHEFRKKKKEYDALLKAKADKAKSEGVK